MQVKDVMTPDPACCTADTSLQEVAKLMVDHDCGEIPIVDEQGNKKAHRRDYRSRYRRSQCRKRE